MVDRALAQIAEWKEQTSAREEVAAS